MKENISEEYHKEILRTNGLLQSSLLETRYHCEVYKLSLQSIMKILNSLGFPRIQMEGEPFLKYSAKSNYHRNVTLVSQKQALDKICMILKKAKSFINGYSIIKDKAETYIEVIPPVGQHVNSPSIDSTEKLQETEFTLTEKVEDLPNSNGISIEIEEGSENNFSDSKCKDNLKDTSALADVKSRECSPKIDFQICNLDSFKIKKLVERLNAEKNSTQKPLDQMKPRKSISEEDKRHYDERKNRTTKDFNAAVHSKSKEKHQEKVSVIRIRKSRWEPIEKKKIPNVSQKHEKSSRFSSKNKYPKQPTSKPDSQPRIEKTSSRIRKSESALRITYRKPTNSKRNQVQRKYGSYSNNSSSKETGREKKYKRYEVYQSSNNSIREKRDHKTIKSFIEMRPVSILTESKHSRIQEIVKPNVVQYEGKVRRIQVYPNNQKDIKLDKYPKSISNNLIQIPLFFNQSNKSECESELWKTPGCSEIDTYGCTKPLDTTTLIPHTATTYLEDPRLKIRQATARQLFEKNAV